MKTVCVFIGHSKRQGKDTVADFVEKYYENDDTVELKRFSCVEEARKIVLKLFPEYEQHGEMKDIMEINGKTYRTAMIDVVRTLLAIDPLCFSKDLTRTIKSYNPKKNLIILVPDLRRDIELNYFKEHLDNTIFIDVNDPRKEVDGGFAEGSLDNYEHWDIEIENDGTLADLEGKVISSIVSDINARLS